MLPGPRTWAKLPRGHSSSTPARALVQRSMIGLLDVRRDGLVGAELHRVRALAGGHALQVGGVSEDLAEGDGRLDRLQAARERFHPGDVAAAGREVGRDVAELLRAGR